VSETTAVTRAAVEAAAMRKSAAPSVHAAAASVHAATATAAAGARSRQLYQGVLRLQARRRYAERHCFAKRRLKRQQKRRDNCRQAHASEMFRSRTSHLHPPCKSGGKTRISAFPPSSSSYVNAQGSA
jgi:hypothetical protein